MALTDNLVSYWKLDESSGNAADSVASNTLTNNNTVLYAPAKINNGASMVAASSQSLSIADGSQAGLDLSGDMSISLWVNPVTLSATGGNNAMVGKDNTSDRAYDFYLTNSSGTVNITHFIYSSSGDNTTITVGEGSVDIDPAVWTHLVVTVVVSTKTITFYVNGAADSTSYGDRNATSIFNSSSYFSIGHPEVFGGGSYWNGLIDEVGVWSRALTGSEVTSLYNGGAGLTYPFSATKPNFLAFM